MQADILSQKSEKRKSFRFIEFHSSETRFNPASAESRAAYEGESEAQWLGAPHPSEYPV